jgi:hypothetical protein
LLIFAAIYSAQATHLRAGEITITRVSCTSLTFIITITVYTNTGSMVQFGAPGELDFGDGSDRLMLPANINATSRPDLGPNVGIATFTTSHTYSGPGHYIVNYNEPNRNAGILNMFNSVETKFYLESTLNIDPFLGCNNSPRLLVPPIDKACNGEAWYHNPGAYDPDGDSLSYEMTIPKQAMGNPVNNYRDPNAKEFYDRVGINYGTANENGNGPPTFAIDAVTGTITWDSPGAPGEYNIAFKVVEWRQVGNVWVNEGYVVRDMQIVVEDCLNNRPELQIPPDICVDAGTKIDADIFGTDPDHDSVKIEAFSEVLNQGLPPFPSPAVVTPSPAKYQATGPSHIAKLHFQWQTTCAHVAQQAYQVTFKITDRRLTGVQLVQFKTWRITVVGPPPKWQNITVNSNAQATLQWKAYACSNAVTMQVWRRVDSFNFSPPQCVTGMPSFLGYNKIAEVPVGQGTYLDNNGGQGLAPGAKYCYRLVAVYPQPDGAESYVSKDTCLATLPAAAPVITNVTVDKTDTQSGQITVKWTPPFDIPHVNYRYKVLRAEGFTGNGNVVSPHTGTLTDTTFIDTGINTEELVYNYRIVLFNNVNVAVDTSAVASAVRLETRPLANKIQLTWTANVPWSNTSQNYPTHLIYRGTEGTPENQMVLIDQVNVTAGRFTYIDSGQWNNTPLQIEQTYCYKVQTRGGYGNPKIKEPLLNFSQRNCAMTDDKEPPCKQLLSIKAIQCDQFFANAPCGQKTFSNTVTWLRPADPACRQDIRSYNIYVAAQVGAEFTLYRQNVRDTFYIDNDLPSFARCYRISAVDRSGNESELSDSFCFDNCPHYELPNVFTPNGDNCNERFSAFSDREVMDELGNGPCGPIDQVQQRLRCARFVEHVIFTVVNRWGKEVYKYESGGENNIYIDWDGRDNYGRDLSAGVYYYNARVTFTVIDPAQKTRDIKGWVQIVR